MQFVFHKEAKNPLISITGDTFQHLFKSRRQKREKSLYLRNLQDNFLYCYEILDIDRKSATLKLLSHEENIQKPISNLTLGWCVIEPKSIEKALPALNEMGVSKIAFIYSDYSQKNYKIDAEKLTKIAINSCEQCGRSTLMEFVFFNNIKEYIQNFPQSYMLDFNGAAFEDKKPVESILIGPEGGFSESEKSSFTKDKIIKFNTPFILKSQSAACAISAKILL